MTSFWQLCIVHNVTYTQILYPMTSILLPQWLPLLKFHTEIPHFYSNCAEWPHIFINVHFTWMPHTFNMDRGRSLPFQMWSATPTPTLTHTYTGRPIYVTVECESYVFKPECFLKLCAKNDNYTLIIIICLNLRCLPDLTRLNRLNLAKHHDTDGKAE